MTKNNLRFECSCCGECCRRLGVLHWAKNMIDLKGVCKYLNQENNLCRIYERRPIFCNVDAYYDKYLSDKISRTEYYRLNKEMCDKFCNEKQN